MQFMLLSLCDKPNARGVLSLFVHFVVLCWLVRSSVDSTAVEARQVWYEDVV